MRAGKLLPAVYTGEAVCARAYLVFLRPYMGAAIRTFEYYFGASVSYG